MNFGKMAVSGLMMVVVGAAYATEPSEATKRKTVTSQYYVDTVLESKQAAVQAQGGNYVVMYPNGTSPTNDGQITARHVSTTLTVGSNGTDGIAATSTDIPTVGAVNTGLSDKQEKLQNTSGKLVTYGGSKGAVGAQDVYDPSSAYSGQSSALVRAAHVNSAVANGFSELLTCQDYDAGYNATNDPNGEHCLTYLVNTNVGSGTYVPQPAPQSGN